MIKDIRLFGKPISLILLVFYEALVGLIKIISGLFVLIGTQVLKHSLASQLLQNIITKELNEDPQDLFANWLLKQNLGVATATHIGWFLLAFGVINFVLAIGVWFRSWAIRNIGLFFFGVIGIFGIFHLLTRFSILEFSALVIDIFIFYYFWKRLPKYLK